MALLEWAGTEGVLMGYSEYSQVRSRRDVGLKVLDYRVDLRGVSCRVHRNAHPHFT
jgi:hypothetical protein